MLLPLFLLLLLPAWSAAAQDDGNGSGEDNGLKKTVTDDDVNKIAKVVYCPVCESTPLDVCQTQACADWRQIIREMLEEGRSEEEIFAYFSNLYGDRVLAEPPRQGFSLLVWLLPLIVIPLGLILFGRYVRDLRATAVQTGPGAETAAAPPPTSGGDYITQIEKELREK